MSVIVDAEFNEIEEETNELDLAEDEGLPWLEAEEDDTRGGGIDKGQLGFVAILLIILVGFPSVIYYFSNMNGGAGPVADGSTIEAPEGPYKVRPEDAGGKEFAGTGDVAPGVGQGESREGRLADGAGAGDGDLNIPMPPIEGGSSSVSSGSAGTGEGASGSQPGTTTPTATATPTSPAASTGGVGVQLAAYGSRARAEKGWSDLNKMTRSLSGFKYRVVEGQIDIGTVYRLQAVTANRAEADKLCRTLKSQGLDCQVKP